MNRSGSELDQTFISWRTFAIRGTASWSLICILLAAFGAMDSIAVGAEMIVSPSELTGEDGNGSTGVGGAFRGQFLFPAEDFMSLPDSYRAITGLAFRPDRDNGTSESVGGPAVFRLSATPRNADDMSTTFADNIGQDEMLVFDGEVSFRTDNVPSGPDDFDFVVEFQRPFRYDPSLGNLLVDFTAPFDWDNLGVDLRLDTHTVSGRNFNGLAAPDPASESGTIRNGVFVTQFTFTTPPLQAGDSDQDLKFDQLDLVKVQQAAKYLTGQPATWGQGDWDGAPGGEPGHPPAGNGFFDQFDIITALAAGHYLSGPYGALAGLGQTSDGQNSILCNAGGGEFAVDAPAIANRTSVNIDWATDIFSGDSAHSLGGSFDNDADDNTVKARFGSSFGSLVFDNVAQPGVKEQFPHDNPTAVGSLADVGKSRDVEQNYAPVPEPSTVVLLAFGLVVSLTTYQRVRD